MSSVTLPTVYVGLDYHAQSVQLCVLTREGRMLVNRSCENDWQKVARVVREKCGPGTPVQAAIESCCGAADLADELIAHAHWSVDLTHPGYVARIKQSPDKSDFSDARLLADLERVGYLPRVWLAPEDVRELRRLVRYRQTLTKERKNLKLQIGAALREARQKPPAVINPWTKAWADWLTNQAELSPNARLIVRQRVQRLADLAKEIRAAERLLAEQTQHDPLVQKLLTLPGIGLVTAVAIRAEIGRFDRFRSGKQLARFCGLSPRNASSGQKQADAGIVKAGPSLQQLSPTLKSVLPKQGAAIPTVPARPPGPPKTPPAAPRPPLGHLTAAPPPGMPMINNHPQQGWAGAGMGSPSALGPDITKTQLGNGPGTSGFMNRTQGQKVANHATRRICGRNRQRLYAEQQSVGSGYQRCARREHGD